MSAKSTTYDDLEIAFHRREGDAQWDVDIRFDAAGSDTDLRLRTEVETLDLQQLVDLELHPDQYGNHLRVALFSEPLLSRELVRAHAAAQGQAHGLRVRIVTPSDDEALTKIRWELLKLPDRDLPIGVDESLVMSRYVDSRDLRPVAVRAKGDVEALVVVAGTGADRFRIGGVEVDPVDVPGEVARAHEGLDGFNVTTLAEPGEATIDAIGERLRGGDDLLYLACHGAVVDGAARLLLHESGRARFVPGEALIETIAGLPRPPRLVVLASCQSAGSGSSADRGALLSLGPALAEAGVPAVVAMQGNISQRTIALFMPIFFDELGRHGRIDVAMAVARRHVYLAGQHDWWSPVLIMRLRSGRLWYAREVAEGDFSKWPALVTSISDNKCVAICGPGMTDSLLGTRREIAKNWARDPEHRYPLSADGRNDLAQVAQYLSIDQDKDTVRAKLRDHLSRELLRRYGTVVPDLALEPTVNAKLRRVWSQLRAEVAGEPHAVLAQLPFSVYINVNRSSLLVDALRHCGKRPEIVVLKWKESLPEPEDAQLTAELGGYEPRWSADYQPSPDRPLVVQMFGSLHLPESLILTEDDHFDYLIGLTRHIDRLPGAALSALARKSLLFVGFAVQDWDFRILSRTIQALEGSRSEDERTNVAAQIGPDELDARDAEGARRYLHQYLSKSQINVFWGTVDDFCLQLRIEWSRRQAEAAS